MLECHRRVRDHVETTIGRSTESKEPISEFFSGLLMLTDIPNTRLYHIEWPNALNVDAKEICYFSGEPPLKRLDCSTSVCS